MNSIRVQRGAAALAPCTVGLVGGILLAFAGNTAELDLPVTEVHDGPVFSLQQGAARTYLILQDGLPVELGVALDQGFLDALPEDGAPGGVTMPDGHSTFEFVLEMPAVNPTPFRHVTLDWNPAGHEPPGVYDHPHFDVHFYLISDEERRAIHPGDPDFMAKAAHLPAAEFIPAGYIDPGIPPVPLMGLHLVDPVSPELRQENPEPFTRTFLYGTWDGRLIFMEPMITRAFLEEHVDFRTTVPVAERYDPEGYYPGAYTVYRDTVTGEYRIALTDLLWR